MSLPRYLPHAAGLLSLVTSLPSQADTTHRFDQPAQALGSALTEFAERTGTRLLFPAAMVTGLNAPALHGRYSEQEALRLLLAEAPVIAVPSASGTLTLAARKPEPVKAIPAEPAALELEKVIVTDRRPGDDANPYRWEYSRPNAVTATKTDTPLMDTPVSVQTVTRQVMEDQQAYRLQDAVKNVSGVQQRFSGGGYDRFVVRGFDLDQVQYRNGVRLKNLNFDLANVERVEVLKGPASVLYGRAEPGGLINAVTKRPHSQPYYALEQRFGSYDYYRTQIEATGPITADNSLGYDFGLSYLNTNSFRDFGGNDRLFLAPTVSWKPVDSTEFNLSVEYLNEDRPYDSGIPVFGNRVAKVPITRQYDQPGLRDHRENILVDFNWAHHFNEDWTFRNGVVSSSLRQEYNELYSDSVSGATLSRYTWFGHGDTDMHTVYANLNGKFDTWGINHNLLVGGEYYVIEEQEFDKVYAVDSLDVFNPVFPRINIDAIRAQRANTQFVQNESWYGLYFQDQLTLWDGLHLMGGGRYDWASISSGYDDPAVFQTDTLRDSQFSPRVGLVYQPVAGLSLYGQWVESFGSNNGRAQDGKPFQPQTATQYEAGIKTEWLQQRLTATLAYFHLTKQNLVTTDPNDTRFSLAIGEARSQGVEVDIAGKLTDGLNLIATYAYTDAEITRDYSGQEGNRLPYAAPHTGSLWLKYDFQEEYLDGLSMGGGIYLADRRYGDTANSYSDSGYARLDLYTAYRYKLGAHRLIAQLNLNNITDAEYFYLRSRTNNLPAEPLTVLGSLRFEY